MSELMLVHSDEMVVNKEDYEQFKADSNMLTALQVNGVDNWEGYDEALRYFYKKYPEYDVF